MQTFAATWLNRRFTDGDFRATLRDVVLKGGVQQGSERSDNATQFNQTTEEDLIDSNSTRDFLRALNKETQARNSFYSGSSQYRPLEMLDLSSIHQGATINAEPFIHTQQALEKFLTDGIRNFNQAVPSDFQGLTNANSKVLVLAYKRYFARLVFNVASVVNGNNGVVVNYSHTHYWYDQGRTGVDITYRDLDQIISALRSGNKVEVGIGDYNSMTVKWFQNVSATSTNISSNVSTNSGNSNKTVQLRTFSGSITLTINQDIENFVVESLRGAIITAARFNKFKQLLNRAETACLCDCNYCTCDCNYCTCDCNYCTCNCNYCTCNCNYCTCNCNYCSCNSNVVQQEIVRSNLATFCTCDVDRGEYGPYGNRQCRCHSNRRLQSFTTYYKSIQCNCNVNNTQQRAVTGSQIWDRKTTGQIDDGLPGRTFSSPQLCGCNSQNTRVASGCSCNSNVRTIPLSGSLPRTNAPSVRPCPCNSNIPPCACNGQCSCNGQYIPPACSCQSNRPARCPCDNIHNGHVRGSYGCAYAVCLCQSNRPAPPACSCQSNRPAPPACSCQSNYAPPPPPAGGCC